MNGYNENVWELPAAKAAQARNNWHLKDELEGNSKAKSKSKKIILLRIQTKMK
jgi:hypothetical protein